MQRRQKKRLKNGFTQSDKNGYFGFNFSEYLFQRRSGARSWRGERTKTDDRGRRER